MAWCAFIHYMALLTVSLYARPINYHPSTSTLPCLFPRVRGLFEEALSSPACAQDWRWWADYLAFEAGRGQADMARRVFLRGVSACPWSKPLWMNGLR